MEISVVKEIHSLLQIAKRSRVVRVSKEYKSLFSNFISLSILQVANYVLPLITLPYLIRVLGPEKYGLIAFAQAFIQYFNILTDYGFNLSATREISIHREDKNKVSEIFSSVMMIKIGLLLLSFVIMSIIVFTFEKFRQDWLIYYLTFGMVVGQALFPVWFFQGMERMKYITFLNILAKLIFTIAIFVFVHRASDYIYVPLINSLGFMVAGILALWIVFKDFGINFKLPSLIQIKQDLKDGWYIFVSQVSISLFNNTNILVLGFFANYTVVGYFSFAEKIIRILKSIQIPIVNTIYPYTAKLLKSSRESAVIFLKKILLFGTVLYSIVLIPIFIFARDLVVYVNPDFEKSYIVLRILILIPISVYINNILGTQILLNLGKQREFMKVMLFSGIINLILVFVLSYLYNYIGTAISWLITELVVLICMYFHVRKINFFNLKRG